MDETVKIPDVNWEKFLLIDDYRELLLMSVLDPLEVDYQQAIKVEMAMLSAMEEGLKPYGFTPHGVYQIWIKLYREFMDAQVNNMVRHVIECNLMPDDDNADAGTPAPAFDGVAP